MDCETQAIKFLDRFGMGFRIRLGNAKCPLWCDGKHIHGDHYRITFHGEGRSYTFSFWNSKKASEDGDAPTAYDVLACMSKNDPGTFEDFCGEYGYDTDSRKNERTYKSVLREWREVERFFSTDEIEAMQEIN
jgi:hypothetical protein